MERQNIRVTYKFNQIDQIMNDLINRYSANIISSGHSATGDLALNIEKEIEYENNTFKVSLKLEDYWKYLEYGRSAGKFPPLDNIRQWISVKHLLPRPMRLVRHNKIKPDVHYTVLPTVNQLAYLIGRKIAKQGTPATHLLQNTVDQFQAAHKITEAFADAFMKSMTTYATENWGK